MDIFKDAKVISVCTEEDLIASGDLVHPFPDSFPWLLLSREVNAACVGAADNPNDGRTFKQAALPLMFDCVTAWRAQHEADPGLEYAVLNHTIAGTVLAGRNSRGGLTVCCPHER